MFSHDPSSGPSPTGGFDRSYGEGFPVHDSGEQNRGIFGHGGQQDYARQDKSKEKSSALKYGLGGAAVGALAGGVIAHEMTETSDDEGRQVTQTTTYAAVPPAADPYATMPVSGWTQLVSSDAINLLMTTTATSFDGERGVFISLKL